MKLLHYDAFTSKPDMGNPAGILLDSRGLEDEKMLAIAKQIGFNETVFISPSQKADICLRYFTPGHEIDLCGHGTVASLAAGFEHKLFREIKSIETKAGILDVAMASQNNAAYIKMQQKPAEFLDFTGDVARLAESLNIASSEIDSNLPIVYGNTGIWTLVIPIKKLDTFKKMQPNTKDFPEILTRVSHSSIHPFCLETYNDADMHGRHFSSPYSGTIEDPATGTASGVMGAYFVKNIKKSESAKLTVEQGQEIGKDALIRVNVKYENNKYLVQIEGTAVFVKEILIKD